MWSVVFALIARRYLVGTGAAIAALLLAWAAIAHHQHSLKAEYFQRGYAVAHDSAVEATITRLAAQHAKDTLRADSSARAARDGTTTLVPQRARFDSAVAARHPLRLEPLPDSLRAIPSLGMVRVTVESTNEVYDIPAGAAREWFVADSLVAVAAKLLDKYVVANKGWSEAWNDEHTARIGADSMVALYAERLRSQRVTAPQASRMHRIAYLALGVAAGFLVAKRVH